MKPGRVAMLVVGSLFILPGIGAVLGGGGLAAAYALGRDDDGFFSTSLDRVETATVAVTAERLDFGAEPGSPDWIVDALDTDIRLRVANADSGREVFVGIAAQSDVDRYLAGVAHDEVRSLEHDRSPVYRHRAGDIAVAPPSDQDFWIERATGLGTQQVIWNATSGRWAVVVMNADASPGVAVDIDVGARAGFLLPLALVLLGAGVIITAGSVVLIVLGARNHELPPPPGVVPAGVVGPVSTAPAGSPVSLHARLDPDLSRWQWLVKWFLAIPHFVVLAFLWMAFFVLTVVAGVSILFTGTYPRGIFDFNVGVIRWTWRVSFYATTGGIGTDRYPPFSLADDPSYPASIDIAPPGQLSRGLVLVKWWLLAIPHYLIVALLIGASFGWRFSGVRIDPTGGGGVLGVLVLVAGVVLLFRGRYPHALFDLIIGLNRWVWRVVAYAALMTDEYPPFRLDQGGEEPTPAPADGPAEGIEDGT